MVRSTNGLIIFISVAILLNAYLLIYPTIKSHRWYAARFLAGFGILSVTIGFKYFDAFNSLFKYIFQEGSLQPQDFSAAFFLNLNDFIVVVMGILLIFDFKQLLLRFVAPVAFVIGVYTLGTEVMFYQPGMAVPVFTWDYLFVGPAYSKLLILICAFNILVGGACIISTQIRLQWRLLGTLIILAIFYGYVAAIKYTLGASGNLSGFSSSDYLIGGIWYPITLVLQSITSEQIAQTEYLVYLVVGCFGLLMVFVATTFFRIVQLTNFYDKRVMVAEQGNVFDFNMGLAEKIFSHDKNTGQPDPRLEHLDVTPARDIDLIDVDLDQYERFNKLEISDLRDILHHEKLDDHEANYVRALINTKLEPAPK